MFSGIVKEAGRVAAVRPAAGGAGLILEIDAPLTAAGIERGASVAVDGVCLTVVQASPPRMTFDVGPETLRRTALGAYAAGRRVNLERPLRVGDEIGGHFVQGHVDGCAQVVSLRRAGGFAVLRIALPEEGDPPVVEKGSIALNGVSLTVAGVDGGEIEIMLIPETLDRTNLGDLAPGDPVHVEYDVLAKYVRRAVGVPS